MSIDFNQQQTVTLLDMLNAIGKAVLVDAELFAQLVSGKWIPTVYTEVTKDISLASRLKITNLGWDLNTFEDAAGAPFVDSYFQLGMGIDPYPKDKDYSDAISLLRKLVAFSLIFPYAFTAIDAVGRLALVGRWSKGITTLLGKIPEEMGVAWALGGILQSIFDQVEDRK